MQIMSDNVPRPGHTAGYKVTDEPEFANKKYIDVHPSRPFVPRHLLAHCNKTKLVVTGIECLLYR